MKKRLNHESRKSWLEFFAILLGLALLSPLCQESEKGSFWERPWLTSQSGHKPEREAGQGSDLPGQAPPEKTLKMAALVPGRPLVYLYAPDLSRLVEELKENKALSSYLDSKGEENFRDSRLYLKLKQRMEEVAEVLGGELALKDLEPLAGKESALALYDIGELKFLYLSRLSAGQMARAFLWTRRDRAQEAQVQGNPYYVFTSGSGPVQVRLFFGQVKDLLLLSNDETNFQLAMNAIQDPATMTRSLSADPDFTHAFPPSFSPHHLMVFLDQAALNDNPYFRRYWLHRNLSTFSWVQTAVLDLEIADQGWREFRYYASRELPPGFANQDLSWCQNLEPAALVSECLALTDPDLSWNLIQLVAGTPSKGSRGGVNPPSAQNPSPPEEAGLALLRKAQPSSAGMITQVTFTPDQLFVRFPRAVAIKLSAPAALDLEALRKIWAEKIARELATFSDKPLRWQKKGAGTVLALPLFPSFGLWLDQQGSFLLVSSEEKLHAQLLHRLQSEPPRQEKTPTLYFSSWNLAETREQYSALVQLFSRYSDWPSAESESAIRYDFMSILEAVPGKELRRQMALQDQLVVEKIWVGDHER